MIRCFFTDILPKSYRAGHFTICEIQGELEKTLDAYKKLRNEFQHYVENGIITIDNPQNIKIYNVSLLELLKKINNNDMRKYAYWIFSKYPIEQWISDSAYTDMLLQDEYITLGQENYRTFILPVVKREKGYIFSIPFCAESKGMSSWNDVPLLHDITYKNTKNWLIDKISERIDDFIEKIKLQLSKYGFSVKYPSSFVHSLYSLSENEQITITKLIISCAAKGYLEKPDHDLVKVEDGVVWAIRNRAPVMRIYFECEERILYIASLYKGHEERLINEHIQRAPEIIRNLKLS